jgi:hypothetical protein
MNRDGWKIIKDALKEARRMAYGLNFPHDRDDVDKVLAEVEEMLK